MYKPFRSFQAVIVVCLCFFLCSCVEMKTIVNVNKDGSGTIEESFIPKGMMAQIAALGKLNETNLSDKETPEEKEKREADKKLSEQKQHEAKAALYGEGVQFVSGTEAGPGAESQTVFSFKDINKVKLSLFAKSESDARDPITFTFKKGPTSKLTVINKQVPKPKEETKDKNSEENAGKEGNAGTPLMSPEQLQTIKGFFEGMKVLAVIRLKGQIEKSDASYLDKENSEVTLVNVDFGKLVENPEFLEVAQELSKTKNPGKDALGFDPKLAAKFPEIKVERAEKFTVEFK
jgi:hypothetical protein